jgi:hypothetical protein
MADQRVLEDQKGVNMEHQEIFSESVKKHFAYLIDEFGFSTVENQVNQSSATYIVAFQNKTRYVKLAWDLKDAELYFGVHRVLSDGKPAPYQDYGANQFYISTLAEHYEYPRIDLRFLTQMDPYDPDLRNRLDEKIGANAQLLRKYGKDILMGHQWFDPIQKTLIPESALRDRSNVTPVETVSRQRPGRQREPGNASADRYSTRAGRRIDSKKPLPMWVWLVVVGGISLCIGAALIFAFWSLLRA